MGDDKLILLVFSDENILHLLTTNILPTSDTAAAKSCAEAREQFEALGPGILLLGDGLPDGSSRELAEEFLQANPALQVIFLGSENPEIFPDLALALGFVGCLSAPYTPDKIKGLIAVARKRIGRIKNWLKKESKLATGPLQNRVKELEAIFNIGRMMTSQLDLDQVLTEVVDAAIKITSAEQGSILLIDDETGELYMRAARNFNEEFVRTFRLPVDDTYAGRVIQQGTPLFLNKGDPQKIKTSYLVYSLIYVPLIFHGRTIGVLGVDNRDSKKFFSEQHITALSTMADYAAIAIENAMLYSQSELERSKLETILTQIEDGVIVVDEEENLQLVNHVVRRVFGLGDEPLTDKKYYQVFSNRDLLMTIRGDVLDRDRIEIKVDEDDYFRASLVEIKGVGKVVGLHDISYLKELDQLKTEFVNTVSHDLRTPLTSIMGYVELIKRAGEVNEKQAEYIQRVQASVHHITSMITELLNLGKVEGRMDENFKRVAVKPIILQVLTEQKSIIDLRSQNLKVDLPDSLPMIFGDGIQLRQMFENLVGNAVKFTNEGG
ncbi:MAG TPA: GAF domain-containing protein, partial [Anaerolineales bacterium]|nr:GAF domain-containing protein [Anaerolineales bacterium]